MVLIRNAEPSDFDRVIGLVDEWWDGRSMHSMLPRLFSVHFQTTTFVALESSDMVAFLAGFLSQTHGDEAYIHFVGVNPDYRRKGVGRELYRRFFEVASSHGRSIVRCVTAPINTRSLAFHEALGFTAEHVADYDGPDGDRIVFVKQLND